MLALIPPSASTLCAFCPPHPPTSRHTHTSGQSPFNCITLAAPDRPGPNFSSLLFGLSMPLVTLLSSLDIRYGSLLLLSLCPFRHPRPSALSHHPHHLISEQPLHGAHITSHVGTAENINLPYSTLFPSSSYLFVSAWTVSHSELSL
jgi:hypothetical protein